MPLWHVDVDDIIGTGRDLWKSDEEFEEFVAGIYERRRQARDGVVPEQEEPIMRDAKRQTRKPKKQPKNLRERILQDAQAFWRTKSVEELAKEQGVKLRPIEEVVGKGKNLWKSDEELDRFLEAIRKRKKGRHK